MTRAESLALLAENARYARQGWLLPTVPDHRAYDAASPHGLAAVRAAKWHEATGDADCRSLDDHAAAAADSARLAVRSALAAVGLKTL